MRTNEIAKIYFSPTKTTAKIVETTRVLFSGRNGS